MQLAFKFALLLFRQRAYFREQVGNLFFRLRSSFWGLFHKSIGYDPVKDSCGVCFRQILTLAGEYAVLRRVAAEERLANYGWTVGLAKE